MQKRTYRRNGLSTGKANKYLQPTYKATAIWAIGSGRTVIYLRREQVSVLSILSIFQESKSLRKSYEDYS